MFVGSKVLIEGQFHFRGGNAALREEGIVSSTLDPDRDGTKADKRARKLATTISTTFSVEYAMQWSSFFPDEPLTRPYPTFDGRCVLYPKRRNLRDYLRWRQVDCKFISSSVPYHIPGNTPCPPSPTMLSDLCFVFRINQSIDRS